MEATVSFAPAVESVPMARRWLRATLRSWACQDECIKTMELLVTELVTNAVRHAGSGFDVALALRPDTVLRLAVTDWGPGAVEPRSGGDAGGWGLQFVERFASRWGVARTGGAKTVWLEFVV
jgi:anti-sigma regulatory factor (Ser/Thr protein kinase)